MRSRCEEIEARAAIISGRFPYPVGVCGPPPPSLYLQRDGLRYHDGRVRVEGGYAARELEELPLKKAVILGSRLEAWLRGVDAEYAAWIVERDAAIAAYIDEASADVARILVGAERSGTTA